MADISEASPRGAGSSGLTGDMPQMTGHSSKSALGVVNVAAMKDHVEGAIANAVNGNGASMSGNRHNASSTNMRGGGSKARSLRSRHSMTIT